VEGAVFPPRRADRPTRGVASWLVRAGGVVAALVLVALLLGGALSAKRLLARGLRKVTAVVLRDLPSSLPAARREEVRRRLDCIVADAEAGRIDERTLGEFTRLCMNAAADGKVDAGELREIETRAIALCVSAGGEIR
jgi:hypothetical protein